MLTVTELSCKYCFYVFFFLNYTLHMLEVCKGQLNKTTRYLTAFNNKLSNFSLISNFSLKKLLNYLIFNSHFSFDLLVLKPKLCIKPSTFWSNQMIPLQENSQGVIRSLPTHKVCNLNLHITKSNVSQPPWSITVGSQSFTRLITYIAVMVTAGN